MLAEREPVARGAWHTLFDQVTSTLQIPFDGRDQSISELLALVRAEDRPTRIGAYDALFAGLEPHAGVQAQVYDSVVADRLAMDRVRGYGGPRALRDLSNELSPEVVDGMLDAVERHYGIAHRWFARKKALLGVEPMVLADQYARSAAAARCRTARRSSSCSRRSASSRRGSSGWPSSSSRIGASTRSRATASAAARSAPRSPRTRGRTS